MVVFVQKHHQDYITKIEDFVWRMRVSYHRLNTVIKTFQFLIPRYDGTIAILGTAASDIWIICLDIRVNYHQNLVLKIDRGKLEFFSPNDQKYYFNVISFGITNVPPF